MQVRVTRVGMDEREARNRSIAEHIAELRRRLLAGKDEIERQRAVVDETNEHLTGMQRWIEETERQLRRGDKN